MDHSEEITAVDILRASWLLPHPNYKMNHAIRNEVTDRIKKVCFDDLGENHWHCGDRFFIRLAPHYWMQTYTKDDPRVRTITEALAREANVGSVDAALYEELTRFGQPDFEASRKTLTMNADGHILT